MRDQRSVSCIKNTGIQEYRIESLFYPSKGRKLKQLFTTELAALRTYQGFTVTITTVWMTAAASQPCQDQNHDEEKPRKRVSSSDWQHGALVCPDLGIHTGELSLSQICQLPDSILLQAQLI